MLINPSDLFRKLGGGGGGGGVGVAEICVAQSNFTNFRSVKKFSERNAP